MKIMKTPSAHCLLAIKVKKLITKYGFNIATENMITKYDAFLKNLFQGAINYSGKLGGKTPDFVCCKLFKEKPLNLPTLKEDRSDSDSFLIIPLFVIEAYSGKKLIDKLKKIKRKYPPFYPTYLLFYKDIFEKENIKDAVIEKLKRSDMGLMLFDENRISIILNPKIPLFFTSNKFEKSTKKIEYPPIDLMILNNWDKMQQKIKVLSDHCIFTSPEFFYFSDYNNDFNIFKYQPILDDLNIGINNFSSLLKNLTNKLQYVFPTEWARKNAKHFCSWSIQCNSGKQLVVGFSLPSFIYSLDKLSCNLFSENKPFIDFNDSCDLVKLNIINDHDRTPFTLCIFSKPPAGNELVLILTGILELGKKEISIKEITLYSQNGIILDNKKLFQRKNKIIQPYFNLVKAKHEWVKTLNSEKMIPNNIPLTEPFDSGLLLFKCKTNFGEIPVCGYDTLACKRLTQKLGYDFHLFRDFHKNELHEAVIIEMPTVEEK